MAANNQVQEDLARAEAALAKTESTHGPNHVLVSHRLDEVARILRSANQDLARAEKLEQRAKTIRIQDNKSALKSNHPQGEEILAAVRESTERHRREKARAGMIKLALLAVVALAVGKVLIAPSPQELQWKQDFLKTAESLAPGNLINNFVDKSTEGAKEAAAAQQEHNDQIDNLVDSDQLPPTKKPDSE